METLLTPDMINVGDFIQLIGASWEQITAIEKKGIHPSVGEPFYTVETFGGGGITLFEGQSTLVRVAPVSNFAFSEVLCWLHNNVKFYIDGVIYPATDELFWLDSKTDMNALYEKFKKDNYE